MKHGSEESLREGKAVAQLDPRQVLRRCHDRLHRRGTTEDIALTMARLLLAQWHDEEHGGSRFCCAPEEYCTTEGRAAAAARAEALFAEVTALHPEVFDAHERIGATADEIVEAMVELQSCRLHEAAQGDWDLLGAAYEQYTALALKREGGQFFTNRLVVGLLVAMIEPAPGACMLDPAAGSGGFPCAVWRYGRGRADDGRPRVFGIDRKPRLVQLARLGLLMAGAAPDGIVPGDALGPMAELPAQLLKRCRPGHVDIVMTNPPWAGLAGGRITDARVLEQFESARRWEWRDGSYRPSADLASGGVPPEYLFVERCIQWLRPGGQLAIVLPKGVLDNLEPALALRHYLLRHCRVRAVINCHKHAFQPYTGARGCLVVAEKKQRPGDERDYAIFMAINRKGGQGSEGEPIYRRDEQGQPTEALDHDFDAILAAWRAHCRGTLAPSELAFSVAAAELDPAALRLNPQFFLPSLNDSLKRVLALDRDGFAVERLGERIAQRVWKGTRFQRDDLEVERLGPHVVRYFTPTGVFSREGVKLLDLSRCDERRRKQVLAHAAVEGEILITRSGTVGRVALVGRSLAGAILSDDLIRVQVDDARLRAFVYCFLRGPAGQDQLRRNEYGTVQQHLEPAHVADILLPLPDEDALDRLRHSVEGASAARECCIEMEEKADAEMRRLLSW